jgi:two-component system LytT family response regulator
MLRESLASLEQRLDARKFLRIHKSSIVNLMRVRSIEAWVRGEGVVVLLDGTRLKVARAKRDLLERRLEQLQA